MAELVKCSLCGRDVSSECKTCPGCGHNISKEYPNKNEIGTIKNVFSNNRANILLVAYICVIGICGIVSLNLPYSDWSAEMIRYSSVIIGIIRLASLLLPILAIRMIKSTGKRLPNIVNILLIIHVCVAIPIVYSCFAPIYFSKDIIYPIYIFTFVKIIFYASFISPALAIINKNLKNAGLVFTSIYAIFFVYKAITQMFEMINSIGKIILE